MTASRWAPGSAGGTDSDRFGTRCPRCARTQPPLPRGAYTCVYCGATLPLRRWVAHPPPGARGTLRVRLIRRPYSGPPSYGAAHPLWGFPPVVWRAATVDAASGDPAIAGRTPEVRAPAPRWVAVAAAVTAAACLAAACAEGWRYVLLLRGRTAVLSGTAVRASDAFVSVASLVAVLCAAVTAAMAVPLFIRLHGAAAARAGLVSSRTAAALAARLLVPGWNIYGAGLVLTEVDRMTSMAPRASAEPGMGVPRARRVVVLWWWAWVLNAVLVLAALLRAFGRSPQAIADTVGLHIAVDVVGALVAILLTGVVTGLGRGRSGRRSRRNAGWVVLPPLSRSVSEGGSEAGSWRPFLAPASPTEVPSGGPISPSAGGDVGVTDAGAAAVDEPEGVEAGIADTGETGAGETGAGETGTGETGTGETGTEETGTEIADVGFAATGGTATGRSGTVEVRTAGAQAAPEDDIAPDPSLDH